MLWPTPADYTQAVGGYPDICLLDPKLRGGIPKRTPNNQLHVYTGGFSTVFPIEVAHNNHALRCWNKDIGDSKNRYEKIDDYLKQVRLPYFVDFKYVAEGILINGKKWPITRMEWVDGETLRDFIAHNLHDRSVFFVVADEFRKMFEILHKNNISHGDLQNGNILLTRNGANVNIKLIDYDSLFVPDLREQTSPTPGLPEYQHPSRSDKCDEKMDYFSELVIYLSLVSLSEKPDLWDQYKDKTEKGLLFSKDDFANPDQSDILQELGNLSPEIQQLTATLKDYCAKTTVDQLQPLEAILPKPNAKTHTKRGFDFYKAQRFGSAKSEFQKALTINPNSKEAHRGMGLIHLQSDKYLDAIRAFEQAITLDPKYKEAYYGQALAYHKLGDNDRSIIALNKTLGIDPNYQPAKQLLDTIKTTKTNINIKKKHPTQPSKNKDPLQDTKPPTHSTPRSRLRTYLFGTLAVALTISIIILIVQVVEKNAALLEVSKLKRNQSSQGTNIQQLTDANTKLTDANTKLKEKNEELSNENTKLKNQLAGKDEVIEGLNDRIRTHEAIDTPYQIDTSRMVFIPAGEFKMGSNDPEAYHDEKPVHRVSVAAFYIDKYEVTNREYKKFIDANPRWRKESIFSRYHNGDYLKNWNGNNFPIGKANHPVTYVSWYAARAYAQWVGKRLPTEAEWEKAARGGMLSMRYASSNQINLKDANYGQNVGDTTPVGNYTANRYGIFDIMGNVFEWCLDEYKGSYYSTSQYRNPFAGGSMSELNQDIELQNVYRVLRGGGWSSSNLVVRVSYRYFKIPIFTSSTIGFRCVKPAN